MCKSMAAGGQRCPGHALAALGKAQARKATVEASFAAGNAPREQLAEARAKNWQALVDYASTSDGSAALKAQHDQIADPNSPAAALLRSALDEGALLAQANRQTENAYRATLGKGPLKTPTPNTFAQQAAIDAAAQAAEDAGRVQAADPLGLRQSAAAVPEVTAPVRRRAPVASAGLPTAPRAPLPTAPVLPVAPVAPVASEAVEPVALTPAQVKAEERAAQVAERARLQAEAKETKKLSAEIAQEIKSTKEMLESTWLAQPTASAGSWEGPDRWRGDGTPSTRKENKAALAFGRNAYGPAFDAAVKASRGSLSPAEVLQAANMLHGRGTRLVSGALRPSGWYANYEHVGDRIQSARADAFRKSFGENETNVIGYQYARMNLVSMVNQTVKSRPRTSLASRVSTGWSGVRQLLVRESWPTRRARA